jgi:hypothetical protein
MLVCGLDLGKMADFTALCAVEPCRLPDKKRRYDVPLLHRWPLGTSYCRIADDLVAFFVAAPLRGSVLVADHTGVGAPVLDLLRERKPRTGGLVPVTITAGSAVTREEGGCGWRVAKLALVSRLQVLLQGGLLRFAAGLPGTADLVRELKDYQVKVTAAGNETFNAREGAHDDLVLALALACWWAEQMTGWDARDIRGGKAKTAQAPPGTFFLGGSMGKW